MWAAKDEQHATNVGKVGEERQARRADDAVNAYKRDLS